MSVSKVMKTAKIDFTLVRENIIKVVNGQVGRSVLLVLD
jgi:hypothetical protein